jgi:hypothetical protein
MTYLVITKGISRKALSEQYEEGLLLALSATIHSLPQLGDNNHILRIANKARKVHVRYRIILSLSRLIEKKLITNTDIDRIRNILALYKQTADDPLMRRIKHTEYKIATYT